MSSLCPKIVSSSLVKLYQWKEEKNKFPPYQMKNHSKDAQLFLRKESGYTEGNLYSPVLSDTQALREWPGYQL